MKKIREQVLEIVKIAQDCPENLQQACFEILLKNALSVEKLPAEGMQTPQKKKDEKQKQEPKGVVEESAKTQEDISDNDIDIKVKRFLKKYSLNADHLNQLFYKEGDQILPLYDDLKTIRTSESQVRITLLQCLRNAILSGEFQTTVEAAREEADTRKCYDNNNWASNYTKKAELFDFDKYSRNLQTITISEAGKATLADLIKELQ